MGFTKSERQNALAGQLGMNARAAEKRPPPANRNELVAGFGIASSRVGVAAAFVILILNGFSALAKVYDSDGSVASVQALHNAAHDGDTITIPAGTFSWTVRVDITKGITLRG